MNARRLGGSIGSESRHLYSARRLGDWATQPVRGFIHKNCLVELYAAPPLLNADRGRKGKRDNEGLQMKWGQLCNQSAFSEKESAPLAKIPNWATELEFWWEWTLPLASHFYSSSSCLASLSRSQRSPRCGGIEHGNLCHHADSSHIPLLRICSMPGMSSVGKKISQSFMEVRTEGLLGARQWATKDWMNGSGLLGGSQTTKAIIIHEHLHKRQVRRGGEAREDPYENIIFK